MSRINMYKHLNKTDKIEFSIEDTIKKVDALNYGSQRFLSGLVIYRENHKEYNKHEEFKKHTQQLRELLENGWY